MSNPLSRNQSRLLIGRSYLMCVLVTGLACATFSGGCNIVGPVFAVAAGPEKTKPQFELPPDHSTVVFIDDRSSVLPSKVIRQRIAKTAEQTLLDGGAVPKAEVISSDAISPIASAERFSRPKSIADVGAAVGASVVVYATVDSFQLSPDGQQYGPTAQLRVKVIDTDSKARLWPPAPEEWHVVSITTPVRTAELPRTQADRSIAEQDLADRIGKDLGYLFVKHISHPGSEKIGKTS